MNGAFAARVRPLEAEGAYAVLARAKALEAQGRDIIHLEIGQPDYPAPGGRVTRRLPAPQICGQPSLRVLGSSAGYVSPPMRWWWGRGPSRPFTQP
jgi:hypothetical protein